MPEIKLVIGPHKMNWRVACLTPLIWTTGFQNDNEGEREFTFEMSQSIILATLHLTICSRVQVIAGGEKNRNDKKNLKYVLCL